MAILFWLCCLMIEFYLRNFLDEVICFIVFIDVVDIWMLYVLCEGCICPINYGLFNEWLHCLGLGYLVFFGICFVYFVFIHFVLDDLIYVGKWI